MADPYVPVKEIYKVIHPVWHHPTIDVYKESDLIYYFPKLSMLPKWDRIYFPTSYELASLCPVVTWDTNSSNFPEGKWST